MNMYVVDAVRTPRGRGNDKGTLKVLKPVELLAQTLRALKARTEIDESRVSDAIIGCVTQTADQGTNIGKLALIAAGWSDATPAMTINRYCASGLSAVCYAALKAANDDSLAVGGGVEMMSRVPMSADQGPLTHDFAFQKSARLIPIGIAADLVATQLGFSRSACDDYALASQQRAAAAQDGQRFRSIVPVIAENGGPLLAADETPRRATSAQSLAALPAAFAEMGAKYGIDALLCKRYCLERIEHVHHAGNSPAMADGASAILLGSETALRRHGRKPRARILAMADVSIDRTLALTGAVDATRLALSRAALRTADIDLYEVNESFAALMLHYQRELGIGHDRLNVNGGAIALGHAMGSTGSALLGTVLDELELRAARRAVVALCGAAGLAMALVIERVTSG
ncbi:MAG: acetyl-CoA C-acyltransferase [Gammaproteobacteria bacterium]|nr:acetyl-CoA C-acyltransferase [Gammaproteobacteria bacterium]